VTSPVKNDDLLMGRMMFQPLMISSIIEHAKNHHGSTEIISQRTEGDLHRYTYSDCELRARKMAQALNRLQLKTSDRIATIAWNGYRHLELYYGISGNGMVCHTINPRLFEDQISYIIHHADDQVIFFDTTFLPLVEKLYPHCSHVKHWICMVDKNKMPESSVLPIVCYEDLIDKEDGNFEWPIFDENAASALCYTSGTTGNPKGALYSHRSTILHTYASALPDSLNISAMDTVMPVVPMFHVNAWGTPYSCVMAGAKIVFPGAKLDGASLYKLMESEQVSMSAGVPTIWAGLLQYVLGNHLKFASFKKTVIGGSACPPAMMESFANLGVKVIHAWGMTELSPLGTLASLKVNDLKKNQTDQKLILQKQGRSLFGIDMKIVGDNGQTLTNDGKAFGNLMVKGSWVISDYFSSDQSPLIDGWFPTGDVATIDADGCMQITDRTKDVIKSGGEWISSIEIENVASAHPDILICACISTPHPKWDERPILVVVKKPKVTKKNEEIKADLLAFLTGKIAKWWMPDDVLFIEEMPLTATGKLLKVKLREMLKNYSLKS
jgi:fatty-acyl-CoA synthase